MRRYTTAGPREEGEGGQRAIERGLCMQKLRGQDVLGAYWKRQNHS
ncbi:hypothetical protein VTH06DRAFT_4072 [Thermothelomyces fergusii]